LGENVDAKEILGLSKERGDGHDEAEDAEEIVKSPATLDDLRGGGDYGDSLEDERHRGTDELDKIRNNEI